MYVRQLIGTAAGTIVDMPVDVALGCVRQGTALVVSQEDVIAELVPEGDGAEGGVAGLDPLGQSLLLALQTPVEAPAAVSVPVEPVTPGRRRQAA